MEGKNLIGSALMLGRRSGLFNRAAFRRGIGFALVALVLGSVLLWSTPTQAQQPMCIATDAAVSGFSGTLTDLATDCNTLLELMDTLRGTQSLNWADNLSMSLWNGITVAGTPPRVTELTLNRSVDGSIPAALGDLDGLTRLDLGKNSSLSGSIPIELNQLTNLTYLALDNAGLTDPIPDLSALADLEELYLHANNFSGTFPTWLGDLTKLTHLHLYGTAVQDPDGVGLTGTIPNLSDLTSLEELIIDANGLTGGIPASLNNLTALTRLDLDRNPLGGEIPDLSALTNLKRLDLANSQLTGSIPDLSDLTSLEYLGLHDNLLTGSLPDLSDLTELRTLALNTNMLTGSIPDLSDLTELTYIGLNDNMLTGSIPDLSAQTNLTTLFLYNNALSGQIPDLSSLTNLQSLYLFSNALEGPIPDLSALTNLQYLFLHNNALEGPIPPALGTTVTGLIVIFLQDNRLSGTIPAALGNLTNLQRLALHRNQLSGAIPPALGNLANLQLLTLAGNSALTGPVTALGSLTNLTLLWLQATSWTGTIPQALLTKQAAGSLNLLTNRRPVPPAVEEQILPVGQPFEYLVAFSDPEGETLTYHATQAGATPTDPDLPLPAWLAIDTTFGTLSGTPPEEFEGQSLMVRVIANDRDVPPNPPTDEMPFCVSPSETETNPPALCGAVFVTLTVALPPVTFSQASLTIDEGTSDAYTVVLDTEPTAAVTISISAGGDVTTQPTSLLFTPTNWDTPQTVTVSAGHDLDEDDDTFTITHTVTPGSAAEYAVFTILPDVHVTVLDDDYKTGTPTVPQHLNVKNTESGTAKIGWTRPANALQQEQRYAQLAYSIIGSYELQVCNSATDSCRNRDNDNWYVLAVFNNHWTRSFTHQVLAPGVIRDNRYRVRAININGVASPWSNIAELEPTVIEHLLTRSPQHDTVWADFRVVHNPDGKPLYVRRTNLGDGSTGREPDLLLTRKGDYRIVITGLSPQNNYRVDLDFVDTFDSDRKLSGWVWTPRQGVFPLQSIYGKNVMDAEVFVGGAWQDAGGRALTVRMGESGKYRVRMDDDCSGERRVYVRRTSNVAGQLRATPVDADPFQSELSCGTEDWKEITVRARPLDRYPSDMRTEALLRTPFAVQYKHEVWETREGGSLALVSDSSAWVKVLVDRPASAVLPDPSSVTFTDPAAGSTGGPTLSWNAVDGASAYLVEWRHGLNYSSKANQDQVRVSGTSASIPMGPSGHGPITARVRAYSTSGISNWVQTTWDSRPPALRVADTAIFEADGTAGFLVTLNPAASGPVTVRYTTQDESATQSLDYVAAADTLTFSPGVKTQTVWVDIIDDDVDDSGETFRLVLSNPTGSDSVNGRAVIADGVAIATILNRDQQASLSATLPDTASTSRSHSGDLDNPTVVVAFNQAVTSFTRETPSVSVTGATIVSVAAHTETGMDHAYLFTLDPEGDDDVIFSLIPGQPCATGGICTNARNVLSRAPSPLTIAGPEEVVIISYLSVEDATASEQDDTTIDFVVTLSPASDEPVTVDYATANGTAVAGGDYRAKSGTLTFAAGQTSRTVRVSVIDDDLEEDQETLHLNLTNPSGATISDPQGTGTIDGTELERLTARFINMPDTHDGDNSFGFAIEFSHDVDTSEADMKASALTVTNGRVTGAGKVSGLGYLWEVTVEPDSDNDVVITFSANRDCASAGAVCKEEAPRQLSNNPTATVAGPAENTASDQSGDDEPPTATFSNVPASHDGATAFTFNLAFSQDVTAGPETLRDDAFSVSGGNINQVRRTEPGSDRNFTLRVKPEGDGPITITLPATTDCQADGAVCTEEGVKLSTGLQVTVSGPEAETPDTQEVQNNDATGAPIITGTPQVGQILTAETSLIADEDGLTNVTFRYQWIAGGTDIDGATGSSYELTSSEEGQTIRVRVTFTDDADNEESLTSVATVAVAPRPNSAPTGIPTISGTPQVGERLTASTADIGDADGLNNVSYSYQWMANDGNLDTDLQDASDSTYTPSPSDVSKTIKVRVSFSDDVGNDETMTSQATEAVLATVPTEPLSLSVATGDQAQELDPSWQAPSSNGGSTVTGYKVQWKEAADSWDTATDVSQTTVTGTTHTITGLTGGVEYAVRVMATNDEGDSPASTVAKGTPVAENNTPTGLPTISGTAQVGETLTASTSNIDDEDGLDNVSYSYQWVRKDGTDDTGIAGETSSTYTLADADQGQTIRVRVTFTDDAGNEESLTSAATEPVLARPNRAAAGRPTISGTPQVDETLTADTSLIDDQDGLTNVSYSYQWLAGGTDIAGATGASFTLTTSQQGETMQVRVSFEDDAGNSESLTSVATEAVGPKPVPLTATFSNVPTSHDGSSEFTFTLSFSENVRAGYARIRDHAFTIDEGDINKAQRVTQGSNQSWTITVEPDGNGDVKLTLPETTDCDAEGAICTYDDRMLSHSTTITIAGPGQ